MVGRKWSSKRTHAHGRRLQKRPAQAHKNANELRLRTQQAEAGAESARYPRSRSRMLQDYESRYTAQFPS